MKGITGVDTFNLASESNFAKLKAGVDKVAIDKLKAVPVDLSKLSNAVNNKVVKKNCVWWISCKKMTLINQT